MIDGPRSDNPRPTQDTLRYNFVDQTQVTLLERVLSKAKELSADGRAAAMGEALAEIWIRLEQIDDEMKHASRSKSKHQSTTMAMLSGEKLGLHALMSRLAKKVWRP